MTLNSFCAVPDAGDFQVTSAEEEDEPRIVAIPEFTVDSKTERVSAELRSGSAGRNTIRLLSGSIHPIMPRIQWRRLAAAVP
jgi:hypothetical protein